jgi:hypothetical protein
MKKAIRIEHDCGNGLFRAEDFDYSVINNLPDNICDKLVIKHRSFPTPDKEGLDIEENEFCAFKSIEQIQQWIEPEWFNEIVKLGFKIYVLELSSCKEGNYQILFKKENILSKKDITELFLTV